MGKPAKKSNKHFYIIMALLPFLIIAVLECGLRIFGFGQTYPLAISLEENPNFSKINQNVIYRYFMDESLAPSIQPNHQIFKTNKEKDSLRIVVQGGSTAAGFPFGQAGSIASVVNQRLKRLYPDKKIEVISTAMAAVNTYTLLDFSEEIIALKPDAILIYAGHNEYLGIMGAGSVYSSFGGRAATLLFLKLKDWRVYQLAQKVVGSIEKADRVEEPIEKNNTMASVARGNKIPINSTLFQAGVSQFKLNMQMLLAQYNAANIPVFISTLVSNEKDTSPFDGVAESSQAKAYFNEGKNFAASSKIEKALKAFQNAIDSDQVRFRAPTLFNQIIKELAETASVTLVDSESVFRANSENQIIGNELLYEHVHPNAKGYFWLGDAFLRAMQASELLTQPESEILPLFAWHDMPISEAEKLKADFTVKALLSDFPFIQKKRTVDFGEAANIEQVAALKLLSGEDWLVVHRELMQEYFDRKLDVKAAKVAAKLSDNFPHNADLAHLAGETYRFAKDPKMALYYHKRAIEVAPHNAQYLQKAAISYFNLAQPKQSIQLMERAIQQEPTNMTYKEQLERLKKSQQK